MCSKVDGLKVFGGDERIGALTDKVKHGDKLTVGSLNVSCLFTPCHTTGHICYYIDGDGQLPPSVFTGRCHRNIGCIRKMESNFDRP